jgi:1-acyl-sn-glycerol-3-phosphate acyltransferase
MIPLQIIGVFRAARVALHLACGLMIASVFNWLSQSVRRRILRRWSAQLLNILNVSITAEKSMHALRSGIIVTNHISWLDVFVLNAVIPMRFVAKSEVRQWPLIGWLCARAQTLFIERGRARDAARINKQIVELLQNGECLAVFPEGTTTDGTQVGAFHASLLQPAVDACAEVHPVAIRYQDAQGAHSTAAAYIDDLSFAASLWNILNCRSLHVRLVATPSLNAAGSDRRTLTRMAWQQISNAHISTATTGTFDERYEILIPPLLKQQPVTDCAV